MSATNLVEGGGLQVLRDCVAAISRRDDVVATILVHQADLVSGNETVRIVAIPEPKTGWLRRLDFEYRRFRKLSRELDADVWLSLHDITPNVVADAQFVYCHNPAPFYQPKWRQRWQEPTFAVFNLLYGLIYRTNIRANRAVIVQQEWLRREFMRRYKPAKVVTATPRVEAGERCSVSARQARVFLYPSFPRAFKNMEILIAAAARLARSDGSVEIRLTITGDENRYARWIARRAAGIPQIRLIGRQDRSGMQRHYDEADVVLFPSTLETWGLPISEAKSFGKPVFLADLPYAHETLGVYDGATFLDPHNEQDWARAIEDAATGRYRFATVDPESLPVPDYADWDELVSYVLADHAPTRSNGRRGVQ